MECNRKECKPGTARSQCIRAGGEYRFETRNKLKELLEERMASEVEQYLVESDTRGERVATRRTIGMGSALGIF